MGKGWVLATDEDRDAYSDIYAPGSESEWPASAALAPGSVEEVQAIVRLANEYRTPLWPTSRGKNLGLRRQCAAHAGHDRARPRPDEPHPRRRCRRSGYCVLEPGVGFFDLYEHLQREKLPLWMSVPGNAWGSVIGNALDHGIGYTPYGLHARNLCGLEVVLPDGGLMRTGMGAMQGNHSWHVFPLSFGPDWTQMFTQSNLGVVTKAGVWLQPAPESSLLLTWDIPNEEDIGWVVDTIAPLKIAGVIDQNVFIPSWLGKIVLKGQRRDFWDKPGAIPESRVQELLKEHELGYWQVQVRLYGDEAVNRAKAEVVKRAFGKHLAAPPHEETWKTGDPVKPVRRDAGRSVRGGAADGRLDRRARRAPGILTRRAGQFAARAGPAAPQPQDHRRARRRLLRELHDQRALRHQHQHADVRPRQRAAGREHPQAVQCPDHGDGARRATANTARTSAGWTRSTPRSISTTTRSGVSMRRSRTRSTRTASLRRASRACGLRRIAPWPRGGWDMRRAFFACRNGDGVGTGGAARAAGAQRSTARAAALPDARTPAGG